MLNEFLIVEGGAPQEEVAREMRHRDISGTNQHASALRVRLDTKGRVANVSPVPEGCRLWTLRTQNENSFPFIQIKKPLLTDPAVKSWKEWKKANPRSKAHELRDKLLALAEDGELRYEHLGKWATKTVMTALRQRLTQVETLRQTVAAVLPAALERFLETCDPTTGVSVRNLLRDIRDRLVAGLRTMAADALIDCSTAILVEGNGAIYVDADGEWPCSLTDKAIIAPISQRWTILREAATLLRVYVLLPARGLSSLATSFPRRSCRSGQQSYSRGTRGVWRMLVTVNWSPIDARW